MVTKSIKRPQLSPKFRYGIIERDRYTCRYCGYNMLVHGKAAELAGYAASLVVDHVIPVSHGGSSDEGNLVCACALCNGLLSYKVLLSIEDKRQYVLTKRINKGLPIYT